MTPNWVIWPQPGGLGQLRWDAAPRARRRAVLLVRHAR